MNKTFFRPVAFLTGSFGALLLGTPAKACSERGLEVCLAYGGGKACYEKNSCSIGAEPVKPAPEGGIDYALGERFADAAYAGRLGYFAGYCYQYAWSALRDVLGWGIENLPVPYTSAYMFGDWVDANPKTAKSRLKLERHNINRFDAPNGSVIVWDPRECGYNATHGHIEIVVTKGQTACSDGCGPIKSGCGNPRIYVPVK